MASLAVLPAGAATGPSTGDTGDTGSGTTDTGLDLDLDGDGFSPRDGDCDDQDPAANPGLAELCFDGIDNNCDGLFDGRCDDTARHASLRGGGGCTGGAGVGGTTGALFLAPLLFAAWKRSR